MSTQDREPRISRTPSGFRTLVDRRVDPGVNATNPERINTPSPLSTLIPRGAGQSGPIPQQSARKPLK